MKTSAIALTFLLSQYIIVDGQLANAPIKRTRALSSTTTDNIISASSSSKQQQRINTARLLKTKRRRDNNKARLLEDGSMSLATTDSMSMSVSLEPDVKDMFAAADSAEKGAESVETFGDFEGVIMPTKSFDPKAEKAKAEKQSKATKLFRRKLDAREEQQVPIKRRVSPADRFSSGRNLQGEGSMSLATETSMSFLIEPEVKDMFAAAGDDVESTTVEFVEPVEPMFAKSSKVYKSKMSKKEASSAKASKEVSAKGEETVDAKAGKVSASAKAEKMRRYRHL